MVCLSYLLRLRILATSALPQLIALVTVCNLFASQIANANDSANGSPVRFDTCSIAAAHAVDDSGEFSGAMPASTRWCVPIEMSTFVASPSSPKIEQVVLEFELLDPNLMVDDYSPRTHAASPFAGDITIEQSSESNKHLGFNAAGSYSPNVRGDVGGDVGQKQIESRKYQRVAPLEIVAASGTLYRGKGVFFKLKATPTQVLEGDKAFKIFVRSPSQWRGGLIKVRARAQATRKGFPGMSDEVVTLGDQQFLVAVYRAGDSRSYQLANQLASAEENLRAAAVKHQRIIRKRSERNVFQAVAAKLDLTPELIPDDWLQQTLFGFVDPHADRAIRRLPVEVRVALLDFQEARSVFDGSFDSSVVDGSLSSTTIATETDARETLAVN